MANLKVAFRKIVRPRYKKHFNIAMHEYQAIYFYIPKVACTSIKKTLANILEVPSPDPAHPNGYAHLRNYEYVERDLVLKNYSHYLRFCFVRNPWDRAVSFYFNKVARDSLPMNLWHNRRNIKTRMPFKDFLEAIQDLPEHKADVHFRSQHTFVTDSNGNLLVNRIGKFENLSSDFRDIMKDIGLENIELPYITHTPEGARNADYRRHYTDKTRELVAQRYAKDIELFEYEF